MFSIVIPLYNKSHTILVTLNTVLKQSFTNFEVLIINDGSTDDSVEIIKTNLSDKRIRIINQVNQGVSVARNTGVKLSNNKYIAFLDADDEWLPNYLLKMKEAIDSYPKAGMYCCAGLVRHANGQETLRMAKKHKNKIVEINFFENPHVFVHTSATVVSKKVFLESAGFPIGMKRNQDFALFYSLALITEVIYCGYPLSVYVGGVEGQATNTSHKLVLEHICQRYNHVFENWLKSKQDNKVFIIFLKYELRHTFLTFLKGKDYVSLISFFNNLNKEIIDIFPKFEIETYYNRKYSILAIIFIYFTKLRWRIHGYPRV